MISNQILIVWVTIFTIKVQYYHNLKSIIGFLNE